jgi:hypothetical protein
VFYRLSGRIESGGGGWWWSGISQPYAYDPFWVEEEQCVDESLVLSYEYIAGEVFVVVIEVDGTPPLDCACRASKE